MPYKSDGSDVPPRIKGVKRRRQWSAVWNSEYQVSGDEGRAFAAANSVYNDATKKALSVYDLAESSSFQELLEMLVKGDPLDEINGDF